MIAIASDSQTVRTLSALGLSGTVGIGCTKGYPVLDRDIIWVCTAAVGEELLHGTEKILQSPFKRDLDDPWDKGEKQFIRIQTNEGISWVVRPDCMAIGRNKLRYGMTQKYPHWHVSCKTYLLSMQCIISLSRSHKQSSINAI